MVGRATAALYFLVLTIVGGAWMASAVSAEEAKKDWTITGAIGVTTDYNFRGFSQTARKPTVQGNADFTYKWFYAGVWASGLDFTGNKNGPGVATVEVDLYGGVRFPVGQFEFDFGGIGYVYPGANDRVAVTGFRELDYFEFKGGAKYKPTDALTIGAFGFYTLEGTNQTGRIFTFEGTVEYVLPKVGIVTPSISGLVAYQQGESSSYRALVGNGSDSYVYWNAGVGLGFDDRFSLDFRYWDTTIKNDAAGFATNFCTGQVFQCDGKFIATAKVTF